MRCAWLLVLLLSPRLAAQEAAVFRAESALVTVPVLVTDAQGRSVLDLRPEEFRLYDNGVLRPIEHVWFNDELPLALGLVVDISASQRAFLREHRATVDAFLHALLRPGDRAFVVAVNQSVVLESEWIAHPSGLGQVFLPGGGEPLGEPCTTPGGLHLCGGTALWNAVYALAHFKLGSFAGSRALLVLSDGNDTGSTHTLDQALAEVHRAGALVYTVRYPDPLSHISGGGLSRLAMETGGAEFAPPAGDYAQPLERIQLDLRSRYILGISPGTGAPLHELRVEVARPNLTVRARQHYRTPE